MAGRENHVRTDVAVVGAGPAGTAAAISCARAGLGVAILDRAAPPRGRPGETLHPGIEAPLRELGVLGRVLRAGFPRHEGIWVGWDAPPRFVPYGADDAGPWRGFQAWGADLDAMLLEHARDLGAEVFRPCRALRPTMSRGRVTGLETSEGRIGARFVVDAAGSGHWLARRLGLPVRRRSPRLVARFGYVAGVCPAREAIPAIVADRSGWTWTAKVRPNLYQWTRLNLDGRRTDPAYVPTELHGLPRRGRDRGADVSWRIVGESAGPGYFMVGDAASVLDPASSHGVLKAVLSGMLAAHAITMSVASGGVMGQACASGYAGWIHERFEHDVAELRGLYARLPNPPSWVRKPGPPPAVPSPRAAPAKLARSLPGFSSRS